MEPNISTYRMSLDENLDMWINTIKYNTHIRSLPNIKKIVNRVCQHKDRAEMLKVYVCIRTIITILSNSDTCGDEMCDVCGSKQEFVASLESHVSKIKLSLNLQ